MTEKQTNRLELLHVLTDLQGRATASDYDKHTLKLLEIAIDGLKADLKKEEPVETLVIPCAEWTCNKCGSEVHPEDFYCSCCGKKIDWRRALQILANFYPEEDELPF